MDCGLYSLCRFCIWKILYISISCLSASIWSCNLNRIAEELKKQSSYFWKPIHSLTVLRTAWYCDCQPARDMHIYTYILQEYT